MRAVRKCRTKFCSGIAMKSGHSPFCSKCRSRRWKETNPVKYSFSKLRNRAKERGHDFALTFEEYTEFVHATDYWKNRGKTAQSLSINRIRPEEGYHAGNIEAITLSMNSRLRFWIPPHLRADYERDRKRVSG